MILRLACCAELLSLPHELRNRLHCTARLVRHPPRDNAYSHCHTGPIPTPSISTLRSHPRPSSPLETRKRSCQASRENKTKLQSSIAQADSLAQAGPCSRTAEASSSMGPDNHKPKGDCPREYAFSSQDFPPAANGEQKKRVAVIGAGPGGLVAAKYLLRAGLAPTVFEKGPSIGGMWGRSPEEVPGALVEGTAERLYPLQLPPLVFETAQRMSPLQSPPVVSEVPPPQGGEGRDSQERRAQGRGSPLGMTSTPSPLLGEGAPPLCWDSLRTNLSKFTCTFSDHPWDPPTLSGGGEEGGTPTFPSRPQMHQYLLSYARTFLEPYGADVIRLNTAVSDVRRSGDGRWLVTTLEQGRRNKSGAAAADERTETTGAEATEEKTNTTGAALADEKKETTSATERERTETFDCVVAASGFFETASVPRRIQGLDTFPGLVLHAGHYSSRASFQGKRVAVIGASFTGVDIAADVAHVASHVVHVITRGIWVCPRLMPMDASAPDTPFLPFDLVSYRRSKRTSTAEVILRTEEQQRAVHKYFLEALGDQDKTLAPGLAPKELDATFVGVSDEYGLMVQAGLIEVRRGRLVRAESEGNALVLDTTGDALSQNPESGAPLRQNPESGAPLSQNPESGVRLDSGTQSQNLEGSLSPGTLRLEGFDAVILCTGWQPSLSYLSPEIKREMGFDAEDLFQPLLLHKGVWSPAVGPGFAFVGMCRGPFFAQMELQARWVAAVFSGALLPPSPEALQEGVEQERRIKEQVPRPQRPHMDYIGLCDSLASEIGFSKNKDPDWVRENDVVVPSQYSDAVLPAATKHCSCHKAQAPTGSFLSAPGNQQSGGGGGGNALVNSLGNGVTAQGACDRQASGISAEAAVAEAAACGRQTPEAFSSEAASAKAAVSGSQAPEAISSESAASEAAVCDRQTSACSSEAAAAEARSGLLRALKSYFQGKAVPGAVFLGLVGKWRISRLIESRREELLSGQLEGTATFTPRPRERELLYKEEGVFQAEPGGFKGRTWKEYVYTCAGPEEELSVFFSEKAQRTYRFHQLQFLAPSAPDPKRGSSSFARKAVPKGWRAVGEHLCGKDMYYAGYRFAFKGVQLERFCVVYEVHGPEKDYTSSTLFERL